MIKAAITTPQSSRLGRPSRPGRPKLVEIGQREEHILRVAGDTFLSFGFDGTTMDAVAEAARISKRTLYARYPDKTALFNAVLLDLINRWLVPIVQLQTQHDKLRETLLELTRYLTTFALTRQSVEVNRIIISEAQRWPEFGQLANELGRKPAIQAIVSILRHHQSELRPIDFDMAAEQFMSLAVDSNLRRAYLGIKVSKAQIELWVQASVDLFLAGVRRQTAASQCSTKSGTSPV